MRRGWAECCLPAFVSFRFLAVVAAYSLLDRVFLAAFGRYLSPVALRKVEYLKHNALNPASFSRSLEPVPFFRIALRQPFDLAA